MHVYECTKIFKMPIILFVHEVAEIPWEKSKY